MGCFVGENVNSILAHHIFNSRIRPYVWHSATILRHQSLYFHDLSTDCFSLFSGLIFFGRLCDPLPAGIGRLVELYYIVTLQYVV